ncbi:hypothetical protein P3L10_002239 [Capsicum annuum]
MDIVMDSEKEEQYIAKLKGELLVEQLENMQSMPRVLMDQKNVSIAYISEPKEALIEITSTLTMISVADDETTSSLVSEAVRSTLVCV